MAGISTFSGLQTTLRSLLVHQRELDVAAHNVANANTEGYTRQQVDLTAVTGVDISAGALYNGAGAFIGGGVDIAAFTRARDSFADLQYRAQSAVAGQAETTHKALSTTELALNEPGDSGIGKLLSRFWDSWQEVANNPENVATKNALVVNGRALADGIRALDGQFKAIQDNAESERLTTVSVGGDILSDAKAIADLNAQISQATVSGRQPNDLLDRRDQLVDHLAKLGQVTVTPLADGGIQVAFGNVASPLLVDGATAFAPTPPATTLFPTPSPGGRLGALQQLSAVPGGTIHTYRQALDAIAADLVTKVNAAHGGNFLDPAGTTAATIQVDPAIAGDPSLVRTTATIPPAPGANDVALAVARLRGGAADQGYAGLVLRIGNDARDAERADTSASAVLGSIDDRRQSVSGVSLDEEMANIIRFQRGYQASARTMSTMDEMLDVLINRTGRVGL